MDKNAIEIGRLLRSGIAGYVAGARVSEKESPQFGALVRAPLGADLQTYGLIYDIHVDDDGLVRQLVTAENVDAAVIEDNRVNRVVPMEMSIMAVGYRNGESIVHLLPPRPPLSLDVIHQCSPAELVEFTSAGSFGYFRHILRAPDAPVGEILAAHIQAASAAHEEAGNSEWRAEATQELITLLRDDYATLMAVLSALGDALPE
ncbi:MAG: hypothetical protein OEV06_00615 [Anaerolineae bacterium]|nr:hypothetical protein [Anaerolineae bacterium]